MTRKNTLHTVEITDINNLGYGVCRIDALVTFVAGGVTGDRLEVRIIKEARDYLIARIERIISPSEHRRAPNCAVFKRCGGCVFAHIDYEHERALKRSFTEHAFRKAGVPAQVLPVVSNEKTTGYRNKVQYPVAPDGTLGYYAARSHDIVACGSCALESPLIAPVTEYLRGVLAARGGAGLRHLYIRAAEGTGQVMVCFVTRERRFDGAKELVDGLLARFDRVVSVLQNVNPTDGNVILGRESVTLAGRDCIDDLLCGLRFRLSPHSFYQVNRSMTELLYDKVFELASPAGSETITDLFCGVGTIGLTLAARARGSRLVGIELVPEAAENARANALRNGIENAEFITGDANSAALENADTVILDPPRKGCAPELVARLCGLEPRRIVYVSCNPDTLARDCAAFLEGGYRAGPVTPFDLFPRTGHVETVVLMSRVK